MQEIVQQLREEFTVEPDKLREMFAKMHQSTAELDPNFIDAVLGIPKIEMDGGIEWVDDDHEYTRQLGDSEQLDYEGTSYELIQRILNDLKPGADDVVYDLGCGYGRVCLYGALTTEATFKGVEIVPQRIEVPKSAQKQFGIENALFIQENVLDVDISDATIVYMFNPFSETTLDGVLQTLSDLGRKKPLKVVGYYLFGLFDDHSLDPEVFTEVEADWQNSLHVFQSKYVPL